MAISPLKETRPFGFLLVTIDPTVVGSVGSEAEEMGAAYDLLLARLDRKRWPIFERTRNRTRFFERAPVAFYVGGTRVHHGEIVAVARIAALRPHRPGGPHVDPENYLTDPPDLILDLQDLRFLATPVTLRDALQRLRGGDLSKHWGVYLMGGCRALSQKEWRVLVGVAVG